MSHLKTILTTLIFSFSFGVLRDSYAQPPETRSLLSFAKVILNPEFRDSFKGDLNDSCFNLLYEHYKNGGNLYCKSLAETAEPLKNFTNNSDIYLYHYTRSEAPYEIFKSSDDTPLKVEHFFEFFRKRYYSSSSPYFASDSESSKKFGHYLIKFKIDPNAKILLNSNTMKIESCWSELKQMIPEFSNFCFITSSLGHANKLALMILEDSGIALHDYYSEFFKNQKLSRNKIPPSWLQLTGPEWILDAESFDTQNR